MSGLCSAQPAQLCVEAQTRTQGCLEQKQALPLPVGFLGPGHRGLGQHVPKAPGGSQPPTGTLSFGPGEGHTHPSVAGRSHPALERSPLWTLSHEPVDLTEVTCPPRVVTSERAYSRQSLNTKASMSTARTSGGAG